MKDGHAKSGEHHLVWFLSKYFDKKKKEKKKYLVREKEKVKKERNKNNFFN